MNRIEIDQAKLDQAKGLVPKNVPIVMLNLLRYKEKAGYDEKSDIKLSGKEAYFQKYIPSFLKVVQDQEVEGVNPLWIGDVIIPITDLENMSWHNVALMEYRRFEDFCTIVESDTYKKMAEHHRFAALEDTKLIVLTRADFSLPE